jgi:hypothetical protein
LAAIDVQFLDNPGRGTSLLPISIVQRASLWLMISSSWFVIVEPAPYELFFGLVLVLYLAGGMKAHLALAPLILFLLLYNLGGVFSVVQVAHNGKALWFSLISMYMALTSVFFAFAVTNDPSGTMRIVRSGWIVAGVFASITGLIGYFNIAGMGEAWAPISRAQGTFKDPNVISTFLIPPAVFVIQDILVKRGGWTVLKLPALGIIGFCLFLAFSRGAWVNFVAAVALMVGLHFVLNRSLAIRGRIFMYTVIGVLAAAAALAFALSFEAIRETFVIRFSLHQSYDVGETGRFGDQLSFLSLLVILPNGLGPFEYSKIFGGDPHNVYLNAFAAYGWLGGFSYLLLTFSTICVGWRTIMSRTPVQVHALAVFCPLLTTILQGVQIDTDHWRHFYLLLGLMWGLYAATLRYEARFST